MLACPAGTTKSKLLLGHLSFPDLILGSSSFPLISLTSLHQYFWVFQWLLTLYLISASSLGTYRQIVMKASGLCSNLRRSASD